MKDKTREWSSARGFLNSSYTDSWNPEGWDTEHSYSWTIDKRKDKMYYVIHNDFRKSLKDEDCETVIAGPFPTLDAAKAAYMVLM